MDENKERKKERKESLISRLSSLFQGWGTKHRTENRIPHLLYFFSELSLCDLIGCSLCSVELPPIFIFLTFVHLCAGMNNRSADITMLSTEESIYYLFVSTTVGRHRAISNLLSLLGRRGLGRSASSAELGKSGCNIGHLKVGHLWHLLSLHLFHGLGIYFLICVLLLFSLHSHQLTFCVDANTRKHDLPMLDRSLGMTNSYERK